MKGKILAVIAAVALLATTARAEVWNNSAISVTGTAATTTFPRPFSTVLIENDAASAATVYLRLFWCGETPADATTSSIRLKVGAFKTYNFNPVTENNTGAYCAISLVTASSTATVLIDGK